MKTILDGTSRRVGAIFAEIDNNFIEVCNSILRIAFPDNTLKGYAETEPATPAAGDCYLVKEDATVWGMTVEKNDILRYTGLGYDPDTSGSGSGSGDADGGYIWEILPYKITEISAAMQAVDSHIERGKYAYHDQFSDLDLVGDWRQYADDNGFYTQYCTVGNETKGAGTWVTKFTIQA